MEELYKIIKESKRIVFFGGAGVSVASNIPDFRGVNGLYKTNPESIISHSYFMNHTKEFYDFYFKHMVFKDAKPNPCHLALTYLEKKGKLSAIITQNIDGLHQKALSKNVIELHGSIWNNHCMKCHKYYSLNDLKLEGIPRCSCNGIIKPDVVLYEEALDNKMISEAIYEISHADTLIVAGTSLVVYPAASFINYFKGKNLVQINLGETSNKIATLFINGKVEEYLNIEKFKENGI